ncbi:MAG: acetate uptake transporter [Candidatus Methanomethylophilaceae archaeon]|nr:acetate uptake transporter [Candidatus Methanomethylophilaceae archaeon]
MADKLANAGALGLSAFGVTTLCMMLLNTKMIISEGAGPGMAMVLGIGMFFGGLIQVLVGWQEWKSGNTFGATAFTSYGAFWLSFCMIQIYANVYGFAVQPKAMGIYMLAWTLFTVLMFIASLKLVPILTIIFGTASIGFTLLTVENFLTGDAASTVAQIAGFVGTLLALEALYGGVAQVINECWGREMFPIGVEYMKKKNAAKKDE